MIVLAIDTASGLCAACVHDAAAGRELGRAVLDLGKGHAEHLMTVVDEALRQAGTDLAALDRIAVSVGPGSFTGVRVGVAAARGYALALKIPAVGVTTLEAVAAETRAGFSGKTVMVALDGGRGEINVAIYDPLGIPLLDPISTDIAGAAKLARDRAVATDVILSGSAAAGVAKEAGEAFVLGPSGATADISFYATLGAAKDAGEKPRPLYLRDADAKPQASFVLPRIQS